MVVVADVEGGTRAMPTVNLLLRLMVEVGSVAEAEEVKNGVAPQIEPYAVIEKYTIETYWKIPAYHEVALFLRPHGDPSRAYNGLIDLAQGGWTHGGSPQDRWTVWNPSPGALLLSSEIKWAELQLWYSEAHDEDKVP